MVGCVLPEAWTKAKLEDLLDFVIGGDWGKTPDYEDPDFVEVNCIRGSEFRNWKIDRGRTASVRKIKLDSLKKRQLREGDILLEISGGGPDQPVGRTELIDERVLERDAERPKIPTNFLRLVRPVEQLESAYLNYYLKHFYMSGEVANYQSGSNNLRNLQFKDYVKIEVPLAPLPEQTRIANKLDELIAQVENIKTRVDAIPQIINRFRQSVLTAAVTGRLSEQWRSENPDAWSQYVQLFEAKLNPRPAPLTEEELVAAAEGFSVGLPDCWRHFALEQLVDGARGIPYGIVQTGQQTPGGIPTVRCGDVHRLCVDTTNLKAVDPLVSAKYDRTVLRGGEVILAIRGTVGNAAVVPPSLSGCNISREVALIPVEDQMNPHFVAMLLQSPVGYSRVAEKVRGVAQKGINLADVRRLVTPVPPIAEQDEIVRLVQNLFEIADQIEVRVTNAQQRVNGSTRSILSRAFRGELLPQNPKDEPAASLLEKIQGQ